ncbi:Nn.00g085280.m01.CDS01 [Neocucurbitaria sp. VM-36]
MRYSTAAVLSTLAVGQAAASNLHNRHASFHARRQAEAKRSAGSDVNWADVAYDLKDVDWDAVNWSSVFASPTPTPVAQATPSAVEAKKVEPTSEAKQEAAPTTTSAKPAETSAKTETSIKDVVDDVVSDLLSGVSDIATKLGAKIGKNDKSNNGGIWVGTDSAWQAEFTNDANKNAVLYCWKANGFSGMSVNVNQPDISVGLKSGESVNLSFAPNVPAACAPAFADSALALFGGLDQTWFEVTFGEYGAFDISRNVNMNGCNISSKGSKCTSDMDTCVFKCKDSSVSSCEKGTDYDLFNCDASSGGGGGYDTVMAGTGGGCSMGSSGEKIQVVFS